ncbi:MAG: chemotaxis protein CheA [Gemmatimonadales bacterium]
MDQLDDVTREFLVESNEGLDQLDRDLVALERCPGDRELMARIFRCVHTIKAACGYLGFAKLEEVSHAAEALLARLRDGTRRLTPERTGALLALVDAIRAILANVEAVGTEGDTDCRALTAQLTRLLEDDPASEPQGRRGSAPELKNMGDHLVDGGWVTPDDVRAAADLQRAGDPRHIGEILVERARVPPQAITAALETQAAEGSRAAPGSVIDGTIRVGVGRLDRVIDLADELARTRDQILRHVGAVPDSLLAAMLRRLDLITTELQEGVVQARRQPIGEIWSRLPRLVRDLAMACGKRIRLEMEGAETELDRAIIEAIKDPLTHIVRNSADHGIELPEIRRGRGKPVDGRIVLRARHETGQLTIEIEDDGGGIDPATLRAKAVEQGLLTVEAAAQLPDRDLFDLVFRAGFTTAERVTNVSGCGVGMDVVRTNVARVGGTVEVASAPRRGTTVRIRIPHPPRPGSPAGGASPGTGRHRP